MKVDVIGGGPAGYLAIGALGMTMIIVIITGRLPP